MVKKVAPIKNTSGSGFAFEDKVAAYFLAHLLTDTPPLDATLGTLNRIDFQVRADGWHLDDILLTLRSGIDVRRCAFSIKSNKQFTSKKFPEGFVQEAWDQLADSIDNPFDPDKDRLGIITYPLASSVNDALNQLLGAAKMQAPEDLNQRITTKGLFSSVVRNLYDSINCPSGKFSGDMLCLMQHLPLDLDNEISHDKQRAIELCRNALVSKDIVDAELLWDHLLAISSKCRTSGGCVDLKKLLSLLRQPFELAIAPQYTKDINILYDQSKCILNKVPDLIGGHVRIEREECRGKINQAVKNHRVTVLIGESGSGKTVLAKRLIEEELSSRGTFWFDARQFDEPAFSQLQYSLGHSLEELFAIIPDESA